MKKKINVTLDQFKEGLQRRGDTLRRHGILDPQERSAPAKYRPKEKNISGAIGRIISIPNEDDEF